jgi:hypothetical protein
MKIFRFMICFFCSGFAILGTAFYAIEHGRSIFFTMILIALLTSGIMGPFVSEFQEKGDPHGKAE